MGEMLTGRQKMILGILNSRKSRMSGAEIADYLGVTDRTVRTDMQQLAAFLHNYGVEIDAVRGKGYLLKSQDPKVLQEIVYENAGLLTQDDRVRAILEILLDSRDPADLGEMEDELYVSRSTLESDLRRIIFQYEKEQPHIHLIRKRNTVQLETDEWKRRYVWNLLLLNNWNYNYEGGLRFDVLPVPEKEMDSIRDAVNEALEPWRLRLMEYDYLSFIFSVAIAVRRIRMGFCIDAAPGSGKPRTRRVVDSILKVVESKTGVPFPEPERETLSYELHHRLQYNDEQFTEEFWSLRAESPYAAIINRTLEEADEELGLSLSGRQGLKSELLYMLVSQVENPYHTGIRDANAVRLIRTVCMDGMELACRFAGRVAHENGRPMTENFLLELASSLSVALQSESERLLKEGARIQVVSHMSLAGTRILMSELMSFFGSRIRLLDPMPVSRWRAGGRHSCDLAVATTRIELKEGDVPLLSLQGALSKASLEQANFLLTLIRYRTLYPGHDDYVSDMIGSWRLYYEEETVTRWELLKKLSNLAAMEFDGDRIEEADRLCRELEARERLSSTALQGGAALPHSWRYNRGKEQVVGVLLKNPTDWGGVQADSVFLLTMGPEHHTSFMRAYACLGFIIRHMKARHLLDDIRLPGSDPRDLGRILRKRVLSLERQGDIQ